MYRRRLPSGGSRLSPQAGDIVWELNWPSVQELPHPGLSFCEDRVSTVPGKNRIQRGWPIGQGPALSRRQRPRKNSKVTCHSI